MQIKRKSVFTTVTTEGSILPPDLLKRILDGDRELLGLDPDAYHLGKGERINEAINRSWNRLLGVWGSFQVGLAKLSQDDPATTHTREHWLLILFQELGYGRLQAAKPAQIGDRSYPISHSWQRTPIHLVGYRIDLDHRTAGIAGAARMSPHSLMQEYLNRSGDHLWGFVSNGQFLRILRDNISLTRQAHVEFDLQSMMDGEIYSDFVLLWLLCHQSRVEGEHPVDCWLEKWSLAAQKQGTRVLEQLRSGVKDAISAFGQGFLAHPANRELREKLYSGRLTAQDFYRQLLRLVYRLIFLFVAEERDLLLDPEASSLSRQRYLSYYSTARIRHLGERRRGTQHDDLYRGLRVIMKILGTSRGCPELGLSALGSWLWSDIAMPDLDDCAIANRDLLDAIRALTLTSDGDARRPVDYKNLGSEELGSVYESLLELHPEFDLATGNFKLETLSGNERRTTGSYYTPSSLINCLLDSALDPVLDEAAKQADPANAILNLKICDPASGSGHFLTAAAHRIAKRLAAIQTGDDEPAPKAIRSALREVISRCLYAVDVNEMAVELCKVSLWMEALEPGKPLSFLDHRILCGNSLLGTTPALLDSGIPEDAFNPIEGDQREVCRQYKRINRQERNGQDGMLVDDAGSLRTEVNELAHSLSAFDQVKDENIAIVKEKEERYRTCISSSTYLRNRFVADAWCAAFVWKKTDDFPYLITENVFRKLRRNPSNAPDWILKEVQRLAEQYQFFHWHLAFPDVFHLPKARMRPNNMVGWSGGFDVVLGNPPWERVKLQEKEWFTSRSPDIANAPNAAVRRRLIEALAEDDPDLYRSFLDDRRKAEGESYLIRNTGRFPLCGRGDVNTYAVFAEIMRMLMNPTGRAGCIVPSGIATDDTTKFFFQDIMDRQSLVSLYDFENREAIFPGVHRSYKFCLLTLTGSAHPSIKGADFIFFAHKTDDLSDPERRFALNKDDLALMNPNTHTCPIFRSWHDAEITHMIYSRVPVLIKDGTPEENPWGVRFVRMIDMANDSQLFCTRQGLEANGFHLEGNIFYQDEEKCLPLYEAKMIDQYDHRASKVVISETATIRQGQPEDLTLAEHQSPECLPLPRYWVSEKDIQDTIPAGYNDKWFQGFADVTSATNHRTMITTIIPKVAVGHTLPLIIFPENMPGTKAAFLVSIMNSYIFDYVGRQKLGGIHYTYFILKQLPIFPPNLISKSCPWFLQSSIDTWICSRVIELIFISWDLKEFAKDCGYSGNPFCWNEERRFLICCELDAAYFHLYGINREAVDYIMETFPIVKRKDVDAYGTYRTKEQILEIYEQMANAVETGKSYQTALDPPPGPPATWPPDSRSWPSHIHTISRCD
jgi:hypothetical protein